MVTDKYLGELEERVHRYQSVISNVKDTPEEFVDIEYLKGIETILLDIERYLEVEMQLNS